jgi:hypothetical protein
MKKYSLLFSLLFFTLSNTFCYAQNWLNLDAEWNYTFNNMQDFVHQRLFYEKDTVVEFQECQKISVQNILFSCHDTVNLQAKSLYTFARNDTVWFYYKDAFRPVYFFNAQLGDTLEFYNPLDSDVCDSITYQVVDSVGTIQVNDETLRFYRVEITEESFLIRTLFVVEKIGAIDNYLLPYFDCFIDGAQHILKCYNDEILGLYQVDSQISCNCVATSISVKNDALLRIYPNPAKDYFAIENLKEETNISVYNLQGQIMKEIHLKDSNIIHVGDLPRGVYVLKASDKQGKIFSGKIVLN